MIRPAKRGALSGPLGIAIHPFGLTLDSQSGSLWKTENGRPRLRRDQRLPRGSQLTGPPDRFGDWKSLDRHRRGTTTGGELKFDPEKATVKTGVQVSLTFRNRDVMPHSLTFGEPINAKTSTVVAPGTSEIIQFTAPPPGAYKYVGTIHPGMEGTLEVAP